MRKVKITGDRSIATKLHRLAYELEHDANRVGADYGQQYASIVNGLRAVSSELGSMARRLED